MGVINDIAAIPNIGLKENHIISTQNACHFRHFSRAINIYCQDKFKIVSHMTVHY